MHCSLKTAAGAAGFVLLGMSALVFLLTQISNRHLSLTTEPTYAVSAVFADIGDLKVGAHVSMSGVEVGRVIRIDFDSTAQRAVVSMRLNTHFNQIPNDSSAGIYTQGLLGRKFIGLKSGRSDVYLQNQDRITATHSAIPLEAVIGQLFTRYLKSKGAPIQGAVSGAAGGAKP